MSLRVGHYAADQRTRPATEPCAEGYLPRPDHGLVAGEAKPGAVSGAEAASPASMARFASALLEKSGLGRQIEELRGSLLNES